MNKDVGAGGVFVGADFIAGVRVVESKGEMELAVGIEAVYVVDAFGHLTIAFFAFGAESSGGAEDGVGVIEGEFVTFVGLEPDFEFFFGFECANVESVNILRDWLV